MWIPILFGVAVFILSVALYDILQRRHAILRNYPVIGHLRYLLESVGPELRQYIVTNNDEERPFSRDQRRWIYSSAKKQNNYFGFGTDNELETSPNYLIIKQAAFPTPEPQVGEEDYDELHRIGCAKTLGAPRGRRKAFRPESVFYISAMSYGSLSGPAIEAINRGVAIAGGLHNSGEGGVSRHHLHGGDLIWQLGTGYFGARDRETGRFSMELLKEKSERFGIKAIEIKLSQGAKPGRGGVLPAAKISKEIAEIRGIPMDKDCISPAAHAEFRCVDSLLDFVERIAEETGLPVGIKSAVGEEKFWADLACAMESGERGVDFINIDGGEGGTGAAPRVFSDHVALPFKIGFSRVFHEFKSRGIDEKVLFMGAGRLGFPEQSALAFALGVDMIGLAREAMLSIGCIQALRCHTGHCPAGVATQNAWLMRGLDPTDKGARMANYLVTLRKEVMWLTRALGLNHPSEITLDHFEILDEAFGTRRATEVFGRPSPTPLILSPPREPSEDLSSPATKAALVQESAEVP